MLKYQIRPLWKEAKIEAVEVVRETEQSVFIKADHRSGGERRQAKYSEYGAYYDTWEAARAELLKLAEQSVNSARRSLERATGFEGNVKGMKPPMDTGTESTMGKAI